MVRERQGPSEWELDLEMIEGIARRSLGGQVQHDVFNAVKRLRAALSGDAERELREALELFVDGEPCQIVGRMCVVHREKLCMVQGQTLCPMEIARRALSRPTDGAATHKEEE